MIFVSRRRGWLRLTWGSRSWFLVTSQGIGIVSCWRWFRILRISARLCHSLGISSKLQDHCGHPSVISVLEGTTNEEVSLAMSILSIRKAEAFLEAPRRWWLIIHESDRVTHDQLWLPRRLGEGVFYSGFCSGNGRERLRVDAAADQGGCKHTKLAGGGTWLVREFTDSWGSVELEGALQWANGKSCSWRRSHEGQISKFGFYLGDIGGCLSYLSLCNKAP